MKLEVYNRRLKVKESTFDKAIVGLIFPFFIRYFCTSVFYFFVIFRFCFFFVFLFLMLFFTCPLH